MKNKFGYIITIALSILLCVITFNVCIDYTNRFNNALSEKIYNIDRRCDSLENVILNMSISRRDTVIINITNNSSSKIKNR